MQYVNSQFAQARGLVGRLAGAIMAFENRKRNQWAISLLQTEQGDRVLEVGFGPGWAIAQMARRVTDGLVAGADASATMVAQASRRNASAIKHGRVCLKHAPASACLSIRPRSTRR